MALATKERSKRLSDTLYELMKKDIIECKLEPGELIEESFVIEHYQIGRTPFREACQKLEAEGLVEVVPHRGVFVVSFSSQDIKDLFEWRLIVEPSAAELACERMAKSEIRGLEENLQESARLVKNRKSTFVSEINWNSKDFHIRIARATRNRELVSAVESIQNKLMHIVVFATRRSPEDFNFNSIHPEILETIKRRKSMDVRRAMTKDIEHAHQWILEFTH
jgi:DNA-binding GntR family transcriptional regulator